MGKVKVYPKKSSLKLRKELHDESKPKGKPEEKCAHCGIWKTPCGCPVKKADPADKLSREKEMRDRQRTDFQ